MHISNKHQKHLKIRPTWSKNSFPYILRNHVIYIHILLVKSQKYKPNFSCRVKPKTYCLPNTKSCTSELQVIQFDYYWRLIISFFFFFFFFKTICLTIQLKYWLKKLIWIFQNIISYNWRPTLQRRILNFDYKESQNPLMFQGCSYFFLNHFHSKTRR